MYEYIKLTIDGNMAILTLHNPAKRNAINFTMIDEIHQALDQITRESKVRALVLYGDEKAFCAGMDITRNKTDEFAVPPTENTVALKLHTLYNRVEKLPFAVIAAVAGFALGGGFELALACDIRIFADNAKVGLPELKIGTIPCGGGTQRLPRLIGAGRAKELIFTCAPIDAGEAYRMGIANRVVSNEMLLDEATTLARQLAAQAPLAIEMAKHAVDMGMETTLEQGLLIESRNSLLLKRTADYIEGAAAFKEKRTPVFQGR